MTKRMNMILYVLSLSLVMTGCGNNTYPNVEPVSVEADTIQTKEIEITEKEEPKVAEPEVIEPEIAETEDEEAVEEEPEPEEKKKTELEEFYEHYATPDEAKELQPPASLLTEVTDEAREEYERRKSEGIVYEPENIYNEWSELSDAEIIEIVNARYLELHNELRAQLGVAPLTETNGMHKAATIRAEEISYFWSHTRPNGTSGCDIIPWDGVSYQEYGENIVWSGGFESSINKYHVTDFYEDFADRGFKWLCNSPSHYEAIINPKSKLIGIDSYVIRYKDFIGIYTAFEFSSC